MLQTEQRWLIPPSVLKGMPHAVQRGEEMERISRRHSSQRWRSFPFDIQEPQKWQRGGNMMSRAARQKIFRGSLNSDIALTAQIPEERWCL